MEKFIYQDLSPEQRAEAMEKTSQSQEKITYTRHLTDAEIDAESKTLANLCKKRKSLEEEKSDVMKSYTEQINGVKVEIDNHSDIIQRGEKEENEKCYKFINFDTKEVGFYNKYGELVKTRKALDSDLQLDMFGDNRKAGKALPNGHQLPPADPNADIEEAEIVDESEEETQEESTPVG